ncbi:MAG: zinc ABC transporter substrate-binding protein, partial [Gammaproteobacteria bacterium]
MHTKPVLLLLALLLPGIAQARLNVFACEPEWGALAEVLGGEDVRVFTATTARQDPHHIQARPGLIARMRRADLVVCTGAELEIGWLPLLLRKAHNGRVQPGRPGYFLAANHVRLLERPARLDRAEGDIHPLGNPHIQTDPHNIARVADALAEHMEALDDAHADRYRQRLQAFQDRWQQAIHRWEER